MPDTILPRHDDRIPHRSPDAVAEPMHDQIMLLHTRTEQYFSMDEVGARVWELIDGRRSLGDIVAALQTEYAVDESDLRADLRELLADLAAHQLVTWTSE